MIFSTMKAYLRQRSHAYHLCSSALSRQPIVMTTPCLTFIRRQDGQRINVSFRFVRWSMALMRRVSCGKSMTSQGRLPFSRHTSYRFERMNARPTSPEKRVSIVSLKSYQSSQHECYCNIIRFYCWPKDYHNISRGFPWCYPENWPVLLECIERAGVFSGIWTSQGI